MRFCAMYSVCCALLPLCFSGNRVWDVVEYSVTSIGYAHPHQQRGAYPICLGFTDICVSGWSEGRYIIILICIEMIYHDIYLCVSLNCSPLLTPFI